MRRRGINGRDLDDGAKEKYSPSEFIIPATDHHGHSVRKQFRCQATMSNEIAKIMQSKKFPFNVEGDFLRWAAWEGVKRLERIEEVPDSMYSVANNMIQVCRTSQVLATFNSSLDETERAVKQYMDMGMEQEAMKMLSNLRDEARKIQEPMWKEKYLSEFKRRFGYMDERAKGSRVKLTGGE